MASFGVSDAIQLCSAVIVVYNKCKNAPAEINEIADEVERMKHTLGLLRRAIVSEEYFTKKYGADGASLIIKDIPPLKKDIKKITKLVEEWHSFPPTALLNRAKFIAWDLSTLKDLKLSLEKYSNRLQNVLELLKFANQESKDAETKANLADVSRQRVLADKAKKFEDAKSELHRQQILEIHKAILECLKKQEEKGANAVSLVARSGNKAEVAALESTLVQNGRITNAEVKTHLEPLLFALQSDLPTQSVQVLPRKQSNGGTRLQAARRGSRSRSRSRGSNVSIDEPSTTPNGGPTDLRPASPVRGKSPAREPPIRHSGNIKILFIDTNNGVRSVFASAYLELLRVITVNSTRRWLFRRASSAGICVKSPLTEANVGMLGLRDNQTLHPSGTLPDKRIFPALIGTRWNNLLKGYPYELESIQQRAASQRSIGLRESDFEDYDYILCFHPTYERQLSALCEQWKAKSSATNAASVRAPQIRLLSDWHLYSAQDCLNDPKKMEQLASTIKTSIKSFLASEFGWDVERCWREGQGIRTLQLILSAEEMADFLVADEASLHVIDDWQMQHQWKEISGCRVRITSMRSSVETKWLVSIIGKEENLRFADAYFRGIPFRPNS